MKTPITLARLKTHLTYSWWKYLLAVVLCALGMNLFFTVTRARAREDQKIEWIIYGDMYNSAIFSGWMEKQRAENYPDQAEFVCENITLATDAAGAQAFMVRVGVSGDGDLLIVPRASFENYAENGLFMDLNTLEGVPEALAEQKINAESGRWKGPDGAQHAYGIPVSRMPVLNSWFVDPSQDYLLCVRTSNGNETITTEMLIRVLNEWTRGNDSLSYSSYLEQTGN